MQDEIKTAGVIGLVGAALGAGVALGLGLRFFSAAAGSRPRRVLVDASPDLL
jgi:uncharacterized membrane-anchored protein